MAALWVCGAASHGTDHGAITMTTDVTAGASKTLSGMSIAMAGMTAGEEDGLNRTTTIPV